jgi:hypothetical protein
MCGILSILFFRFIAMLFLERFWVQVSSISVLGFGGSGHAQSKSIAYHQLAAEHRYYPSMVEEGVLNVLDPTVLPCAGARAEPNADLPCPGWKKRDVQKKLDRGRVLCRCGRKAASQHIPNVGVRTICTLIRYQACSIYIYIYIFLYIQ